MTNTEMDFTLEEKEKIKQLRGRIKGCDTDKPYIFISYSKKDSLRVYPMIIELQKIGCNIWIDKELEGESGKNWQEIALDSLEAINCKAIFFMLSSNSLKSAPVFAEIMYSQDGRSVIRNHGGDSLTLRIVVADGKYNLANGNIRNTVNKDIAQNDTTPLSDADYKTIKAVKVINEELYEGRTRLKTKGNLAYEFYDCLFEEKLGGGGNVTFANYENIDTVIKNIPDECKCIEVSDPPTVDTEPDEVPDPQPTDPVPDKPDSGNASDKKSTSTDDITYTLYGTEYTHNQSNMMLNVFAKVLKRHPEAVDKILENPVLRCASAVNYELPENRTDSMLTYFRNGCYFDIGRGIYIGTSMNYNDKLRNISMLLKLCNEDFSVLQSDSIKLPTGVKTKDTEIYYIDGEERSGNQSQMMIDVLKFLMEKHFDKREELAGLSSIKLSPLSELSGVSYFRTGEEFSCNGVTCSIGTSFGRADKLIQMAKAINICGEDSSQFEIAGLEEVTTEYEKNSPHAYTHFFD